MNREPSTSQAAIFLVLLLALVSGASGVSPLAPCQGPHEVAHVEGWTTAVSCGSVGEGEWGSGILALHGPAELLFGRPMDLNEVEARALEVLPGIGPARARAIVAARSEGRFESLRELESIPGIGPVTVSRLEGWVQVARHSSQLSNEE